MDQPTTVWTLGHSTRAWEAFLAMLSAHGIEAIADVRRFPGSRRHPHFGRELLEPALRDAGFEYLWLPQLGGRRSPRPDSPHAGWRNAAFRGYADHLSSIEFADGTARLLALAARKRTAIMCSEAVWWRCHRGLVSDVLKLRGIQVLHVEGTSPAREHPWTPPARVEHGRLSYPDPAEQKQLFG
jgi:uncharacterized protein (DUF488 family)